MKKRKKRISNHDFDCAALTMESEILGSFPGEQFITIAKLLKRMHKEGTEVVIKEYAAIWKEPQ